ncbi:MAG: hypothetical protein JJU28_22765 [Cyclobacteriaceae bacterium]|nr:hypothetical protein [Cyclobacteriaceae bacterium]
MRTILLFPALIIAIFLFSCSSQNNNKNEVTCFDDSQKFKADWFTDQELDLPYFIVHFCSLANAVRMDGEDKGFIDIPVWRHEKDNKPYNARIMENIYSLAYFYTTDKPWNPYINDRNLKNRIETALEFWCSIQSDAGQFSEYKPEGWNLAATAFATKFMGEALILLSENGNVSNELLEKTMLSMRKAIMFVLKDPDFYRHGRSFTNQYSNVWSGALAYLSLRDDPEVYEALKARIQQSIEDFQSPVGYFYERDGPDWTYNLGTHENNLMMTWPYVKGTELEDIFRKKYEDFMEWVSISAAPEPDFKTWHLNGGISTRTSGFYMENKSLFFNQSIPIAEISPLAFPYLVSREEFTADADLIRKTISDGTLDIAPLEVGQFYAFSPYGLLHRNLEISLPDENQKKEAIGRLPFIQNTSFFEQRTDTRQKTTFSFIRKPAYYAIFNSGEVLNQRQTFGLGLLWHPDAGTFMQTRVIEPDAAWGTLSENDDNKVFEGQSFYPDFRLNAKKIQIEDGIQNYGTGDVNVQYDLGKEGKKSVIFHDDKVIIRVSKSGKILEKLPFLHNCQISEETDLKSYKIEKNGVILNLQIKGAESVSIKNIENEPAPVIQSLQIEASSQLEYILSF